MRRALAALLVLPLCAVLAGAGEHDPPPPPPAPADLPPTPRPGQAAAPEAPDSPQLTRYQDCFQKMIDAGVADNTFMKRCLGLPEQTTKRTGAAAPLSTDEAEKALKDAIPELKLCYDKAQLAWKDLGVKPNGALAFKIAAPKGVVQSVTFDHGLTDATLIGCFRERLKAIGLRKNEVEGPVEIYARYVLRPAAAPVKLDEDALKLSGPAYGIAPEDALAVFRKNAPKVRKCWDEVVKKKKDATGRLAATLTVSEKGRVVGVSYREFSVSDERQKDSFKACVSRELKRWKFPKPRAGEAVPVEYPPFDFRPR